MKKFLVMMMCFSLMVVTFPVIARADVIEGFDLTTAIDERKTVEQETYPGYYVEVITIGNRGYSSELGVFNKKSTELDLEVLRDLDSDILLCFCQLVYANDEFSDSDLTEEEQEIVEKNRVFLDGTFTQRFFKRDRVFVPKMRIFIKKDQLDLVDSLDVSVKFALMPDRDGVTVTLGARGAEIDYTAQIDLSGFLLGGKYDLINASYESSPRNLKKETIAEPDEYLRIISTETPMLDGYINIPVKVGDSQYYMVHGYELDRVENQIKYFGG